MYIHTCTCIYTHYALKQLYKNTLNVHAETILSMSDDRPTQLHILLYIFSNGETNLLIVTVTFVLARDVRINLYTNSNRY